jgi:cell division protease FtsH
MSSNVKTAVFWVVIICAVVLVYMAVKTGRGPTPTNLTAFEFVQDVQDGKIKDAEITGGTDVQGTMVEAGVSKRYHTSIPQNYPDIYKALQEKHVNYTTKESTGSGWIGLLFNAVPVLILLGLWILAEPACILHNKRR